MDGAGGADDGSGLFFESEAVHPVIHHARGESERAAGGGKIAVVLADGILTDIAFVVRQQDLKRGGVAVGHGCARRTGGCPCGLQ